VIDDARLWPALKPCMRVLARPAREDSWTGAAAVSTTEPAAAEAELKRETAGEVPELCAPSEKEETRGSGREGMVLSEESGAQDAGAKAVGGGKVVE
jgi:hypothetical protein